MVSQKDVARVNQRERRLNEGSYMKSSIGIDNESSFPVTAQEALISRAMMQGGEEV